MDTKIPPQPWRIGSGFHPAQPQAADSKSPTSDEITRIATSLSTSTPLTESEEQEVIRMCWSYLGSNTFGEINLTPAEFKQRKNELLDLALEFRLNEDGKAAQIIARGMNLYYRMLHHPELDYYLAPIYLQMPIPAKFMKFAADNGRKVAQFAVGTMYLEGKNGLEKNIELATQYFRSSANQGYEPAIQVLERLPKSNYQLAKECENTEPAKALKLYKQAASEGDVNAMFRLGELSRKDPSIAIKYFKQADEKGHLKAAFELAELFALQYKECTFKFLNAGLYAQVIHYYDKSEEASAPFKCLKFKADNGDNEAQYQVGRLYLFGTPSHLPSKDFSLSEHYLKLAADEGHAEAAYMLSNEYDSSNFSELASHYHAIAVKGGHPLAILEKKAEKGNSEAISQLYRFYVEGNSKLSVFPNQEKAEKYRNLLSEALKKQIAILSGELIAETEKQRTLEVTKVKKSSSSLAKFKPHEKL